MATKFCNNYHTVAIKKCDACKHEWCPVCSKRNAYKCPNCGTEGYKIHLASE